MLEESQEVPGALSSARARLFLPLRQLAVAGLAFASAAWLGRLGWPAAWVGLGSLVLAHAYRRNLGGVFGKRIDGRMNRLGTLPTLPHQACVWIIFALKRMLLREPCWHRIAPGLYLGRRPRANELPVECRMVVDLSAEFPAPRWLLRSDRAYRCLPTLNRFVPSADGFASLMQELLTWNTPVYVYCAAGRGRSAMLVAALLVLRGHAASVDAAERQLRAVRRGVYLHPVQRAFIARHCAAHLGHAEHKTPGSSAGTLCG